MTNTKKKHGNKMKLMSAIGMLTVSAAMLVSSTFAWFSMNKTVTATSMQVNVKTDSTYLLINTGDNDTASEIQTAGVNTIALTVADADSKVYPSRPAQSDTEAGYLTTSGKKVGGDAITTAGVVVDNAAKAAAVTNWFTADAQTAGASTIKADTARQLVGFNGYVIQRTAYITVAKGANNANNLTVKPTIAKKSGAANTDKIDAVRVLVTTDDGGFAILDPTTTSAVDIKGSNTAISDTTVRTVNIYIYYDGEDTTVYTNNRTNLAAADISLQFDVTAVAET